MTTLADAIKSALTTNWGGTGGGGTAPGYYNTEDVRQHPIIKPDYILVKQETYRWRKKRLNDTNVRIEYWIDIEVGTRGDANLEERLDILVAEVERITTPSNVTGYHEVDIIDGSRERETQLKKYKETMTIYCLVKSTASAITPGSATTADLTVTNLVVNTDLNASAASVSLGPTTVTGNIELTGTVDGVDIAARDHAKYTDAEAVTALETDWGLTKEQVQDLLMFGSGNAAWVPMCVLIENTLGTVKVGSSWSLANVGATDPNLMYNLPLPTNKGSLKLYVSGIHIQLTDADPTNKLTNTQLYGVDYDTATQIHADGTAQESPGEIEYTFTAVDCSSYAEVWAYLSFETATADALDIRGVQVRCYYA